MQLRDQPFERRLPPVWRQRDRERERVARVLLDSEQSLPMGHRKPEQRDWKRDCHNHSRLLAGDPDSTFLYADHRRKGVLGDAEKVLTLRELRALNMGVGS